MDNKVAKRNSLLGIASCIVAIVVWTYFVAAFMLIFYTDGFSRWLTDLVVPESRGVTDLRGMGVAVVLYAAVFFLIPAAGHLIGTLLGVIGSFQLSRKRLFPLLGIALNMLPVLILVILFLVGGLKPVN